MTSLLLMLACAFTLAGWLISGHLRDGGIIWIGWLAGVTTVAAAWSWWT